MAADAVDLQHTHNENGKKVVKIALAGNPNTGKTTIFNDITGARQHVGNWAGVTVELKEGRVEHNGVELVVVDLPGTYSLSPASPEERVARDFLARGEPDVVIQVIDSTNLERNLYLSALLIEMGVKVVYALNMADEAEKLGIRIDLKKFSTLMGGPAVFTVGAKNQGIDELLDAAIEVAQNPEAATRHLHINYGLDGEEAVEEVVEEIRKHAPHLLDRFHDRWLAVRLLEGDADVIKLVRLACKGRGELVLERAEQIKNRLKLRLNMPVFDFFTERRYAFAHGVIAEAVSQKREDQTRLITELLDSIFLNRALGLPIFALIMFLVFQGTFKLSEGPMDWLDGLVSSLGGLIHSWLGDGLFTEFLVDGVISGVGFMLVFLPPILILFFFIALMEDTGYMARVAFMTDPIMHLLKLHGKSIIPLILGLGCNVPAIMGTRILESRRDRLVTSLIIPYISCSARLPVYALFAAAFFPGSLFGFSKAGLVVLFVYFVGLAVAFVMGRFISAVFFKSESAPFVMELPPYRIPAFRTVMIHMWDRGSEFVKRMGTIIMLGAIVVWALGKWPAPPPQVEAKVAADKKTAELEFYSEMGPMLRKFRVNPKDPFESERFASMYEAVVKVRSQRAEKLDAATSEEDRKLIQSWYVGEIMKLKTKDAYAFRLVDAYIKAKAKLDDAMAAADKYAEEASVEYSLLGRMGKLLQPVLSPLGFSWKEGIAIIAGFSAKEIVVSTYGVLYHVGRDTGEDDESLISAVRKNGMDKGDALAFMLFILLYTPCIGTLAALRRETNSWRWPAFSVGVSLVLAWVIAFAAHIIL